MAGNRKKQKIMEFLESSFLGNRAIAEKVGCTEQYVMKVKKEINQVDTHSKRIERLRDKLINMIIDKIEYYEQSLDRRDFMAVLKGIETLASLSGLNAPVKTEQHVIVHKWPDEVIFEVEGKVKDDNKE